MLEPGSDGVIQANIRKIIEQGINVIIISKKVEPKTIEEIVESNNLFSVFVIGFPRSGTSLMTRIVELLGVNMVYDSDVVIFHSVVRPFYEGLELNPKKLKDTTKLLYFHGSDLRFTGKELLQQADQWMGDYTPLVSTPDLLLYLPQA